MSQKAPSAASESSDLEIKKNSSSSSTKKDQQLKTGKQYSQISKVDETVEEPEEDLAESIDPNAIHLRPNKKNSITETPVSEDEGKSDDEDDDDSDDMDAELDKLEQSVI